MANNLSECHYCNGTGRLQYDDDPTKTTYGKHEISPEWKKIDGVFIWFDALKGVTWRGLPGYVYETSIGEYLAPFRGELIKVIKDTRNEFREVSNGE